MIKMVAVTYCDICGKAHPAKTVRGRYNDTEYAIPDGWTESPVNPAVHLCPACAKKLKEVGRHG